MKKLLLALICLPFLSPATTLTGTLNGPDGTGINGYMSLSLSQQAANTCTTLMVVPTFQVRMKLVNGVITGTPNSVYGNDCLLPQGTYYNVTVIDNNANVLMTDRWVITGSTIDVGTIVSVIITGTTQTLGAPGVILTSPGGSQTVTQPPGTNLTLNNLTVTHLLTFPNGMYCDATGCSGPIAFGAAVAMNGGLTTAPVSNSNITIGAAGSFYIHTFVGPVNCGGIADGWLGVETALQELQVCIGGNRLRIPFVP